MLPLVEGASGGSTEVSLQTELGCLKIKPTKQNCVNRVVNFYRLGCSFLFLTVLSKAFIKTRAVYTN